LDFDTGAKAAWSTSIGSIGAENSIRIYTGTSGTPGTLWVVGTNVTSGGGGGTVFNLYNSVTSNILIARTTGQLELTINISSTSTTTGTLVVAGGVGIAGNTYIGGGSCFRLTSKNFFYTDLHSMFLLNIYYQIHLIHQL
jgi:hypothetical protein